MSGIGPRAVSSPAPRPARDPGPPRWEQAITPAEALRAAAQAETDTAYRHQIGRMMWEAGRRAGLAENIAATDAARALVREPPDPETIDKINKIAAAEHQAAQEARWGPGGRHAFGQPRPGDFPGRHPQPEPEIEAG